MRMDADIGELDDELGLLTEIDWTSPLTELTERLDAIRTAAERRTDPTVVVLRLRGATGDRAWPRDVGVRQVNRWERAVRGLERMAAVVIVAAEGTCGGPTLDLLLAADYRIVARDLRVLLPVNEDQFWPGMGVYRLALQLGTARARQLVLWGAEISAARALDVCLADEMTAEVDETIATAVVMLGRTAGTDLSVRRQLLLEAQATTYEEALGAHLAACDRELRRVAANSGEAGRGEGT